MSLIDSMMEECVIMDKTTTPDGESGFYSSWNEGAHIMVAITTNTSIEARIAESSGFKNTITLTTKKENILEYGTVIKSLATGNIYRVTADGNATKSPAVSKLDIAQVSAESWSLPT